MANPFTAPTLTGFNTSPPPNDGSEISANQLDWDVHHIGKIGTPLKNYIDDLVTNVNTAFATVDDASNLTTGKLPDARLSKNVPLKDAANTFTGTRQVLSAAAPAIRFTDTTEAANAQTFQILVNDGEYRLDSLNDSGVSLHQHIEMAFDGSLMALTATSITANGSEVLTQDVIAALTAIDVSGLAATDGVYIDDNGAAKRMAVQDMGVRVVDASSANQTFALSDANSVQTIGATNRTFTIPPNSSVAFNTGTTILCSSTGAGEITVDPGAGVTLNSSIAQGSTDNRTVIAGGTAALVKVGTDEWQLFGDIS